MKRRPFITCLVVGAFARLASGIEGPAAPSGACSHIIGPIDVSGNPIGFTCEDVGGSALLIWNASQLNSNITINGGTRAVNFFPGNFTVSANFTSDGPLAFIGGGIAVTGSITGSSVLLIAAPATEAGIKSTLLGAPPSNFTAANATFVQIGSTGKVSASSGNLIVAGKTISNLGKLSAPMGTVAMTVGTKLDVGWTEVRWVEGAYTGVAGGPVIINFGTVKGANVILEAQRTNSSDAAITNRGTIASKGDITLITGRPGLEAGGGVYIPSTFGVNNIGVLQAARITFTAYGTAPPGGQPTSRTFDLQNAADRSQLQQDIGGSILDPSTDNTPSSASAPIIDAGNSFTVTSNILVPQLAPSLTNLNASATRASATVAQMNATSTGATSALASARSDQEQVRGDGTQPKVTKPKARAKAKPVLVRGAFFDTKISAVLSPNR
jgi:hypothetical protein